MKHLAQKSITLNSNALHWNVFNTIIKMWYTGGAVSSF
jgi:hypothetical protein